MTDPPALEEPATEEPVTEGPVTEEPVTAEPVTEEPVGQAGHPGLRTVSLQLRATLAVIMVVVLVVAGLAVVVDRTFAAQSQRNAENLLAGRVQLARQLARTGTAPQQVINRIDARGVRASLVLTSGRILGTLPPTDQQTLITRTTLTGSGRIDGAQLTLAVDTALIENARAALRRSLLISGLAAIALSAILVALAVRFALRPLKSFAVLARDVINGRRGGRLRPRRTGTELGQAATAVDQMLDALEGAEGRARISESVAHRAAARSQQFLADAAHELRTPIAGVQAAAETLLHQQGSVTEAEREQLLVLLVREARRAGTLAGDLLTAARLDTGVDVERRAVDLPEVLRAEAERTALLHPSATIRASCPRVSLSSDPVKITAILTNLLTNALRATGPDGTVVIEGRRADEGDRALMIIRVADDGPGIRPEDRERIFERLVRLDASRSRPEPGGGSGLGLAISRGYARALGGDLRCVESTDLGGATFELILPLD